MDTLLGCVWILQHYNMDFSVQKTLHFEMIALFMVSPSLCICVVCDEYYYDPVVERLNGLIELNWKLQLHL